MKNPYDKRIRTTKKVTRSKNLLNAKSRNLRDYRFNRIDKLTYTKNRDRLKNESQKLSQELKAKRESNKRFFDSLNN